MRLDQLTVHLRSRSAWEAVELGSALVRRHAAAIWKPWLLLSLPVLVLLNAALWALDTLWVAALAMWWLKPLFDRIPLYVISRATFGVAPGTRETLRAQLRWGMRPMLHYLTWRRFSFVRELYLPIDLLEGGRGAAARERRRVLGGMAYGNAALLTLVCMAFTASLAIGGIAAIMMFVPIDEMPETFRAGWALIGEQTPWWVTMGFNAIVWLATSIIEPFYIGGGFGMYLNRRTQIEAWDVEIAFRRLRERLRAAGASLVVLLAVFGVGLPSARAQAQDSEPMPANTAPVEPWQADEAAQREAKRKAEEMTPEKLFGEQQVDDASFRKAAQKAYQDPLLSGKKKQSSWEPRRVKDRPEPKPTNLKWLEGLVTLFALIGEWGLWILLGLLVLVLLLTAKRWLPWMRGAFRRGEALEPAKVEVEALVLPDALPHNVVAAARRLWAEGKHRHALALLYRASVDGMVKRAQVVLPPGATEAECLRASRRLPEADDRNLFARMVKVWQYAAYAQRLPQRDEFEELLDQLQRRNGWAA